MPTKPLLLLPQPQTIKYHEGEHLLSGHKLITVGSAEYLSAGKRIQASLKRIGLDWDVVVWQEGIPNDQIGIVLELSGSVAEWPNRYLLEITPEAIHIGGGEDPETYWNGACTLVQIIEQRGQTLPALTIEDFPDFKRRGVMLDISRDKVPTLETLYALIDRLASWKINEVQLYMEHTFAYSQHKTVWQNASPLTGEDIRALDQFCKERFIDLVPNQNSFGHMHRWLMHEEYQHLAEVPEGFDWPMFISQRPFSIAASDPRSLELISGLYDELLPNFSSPYFNVGCDETFDLGRGRSRDLVEAQGKGRAYLNYVSQIAEQVKKHGRTMQFWGDIIVMHPELVPEIPKDVIAMEWGYDADHAFAKDGAQFAAAGIPFYVCPGTSSWVSLLGRTTNAVGNLRNAAENGQKYGAIGYLNTDWGDYGHWQALPVSYLGFAYGAALSWSVAANLDLDIPAALDQFAFEDSAHVMGKLAYELGNAYLKMSEQRHFNGVVMARALYSPLDQIPKEKWLSSPIDPDNVRAAMAEMEHLAAQLDQATPADPLVVPEYRLMIALWLHGCKRLLMASGATPITAKSKAAMAAELRPLREEFRRVWLARNRPGGLDDSLVRMDRLLAEYAAEDAA